MNVANELPALPENVLTDGTDVSPLLNLHFLYTHFYCFRHDIWTLSVIVRVCNSRVSARQELTV